MSSGKSQKPLLLSPALTSPLAEEKSWTFPQFYTYRRKGPESQALGNPWVSWARTQVLELQHWDDFGSKDHRVTEKHGESQHGDWNHILQLHGWGRLGSHPRAHEGTFASLPHSLGP